MVSAMFLVFFVAVVFLLILLVFFAMILFVVFLMVWRSDIFAAMVAVVMSAPSVIVWRWIFHLAVRGETQHGISGIDSEHDFRVVCGSFRCVGNHWRGNKYQAGKKHGEVSFHSIVV